MLWYKRMVTETRLYLLGAGLLLIALICPMLEESWAGPFALAGGYTAMSAGLLIWLTPKLRNAWEYPFTKRLLLLGHLGVLVIAAAIARNVMTSATGLPGQDYTIATSALSLLLYPLAWLWVVTVAVGVALLTWEIAIFGLLLLHVLLRQLAPLIGERFFKRIGAGLPKHVARLLGGIGLMFGFALVEDGVKNLRPSAESLGRWIAYYGDYQPTSQFPGVQPGTRVLMHANGVYSIASVQPGPRIAIEVEIWKAP
ncbi:hypothetical protein [[Pseudomonas] boreopolis]|uniref:hypothetical protein n=1 Tax=Xanthomonas boreopolis TaxID=86183 RepID=UPI003D9BDD28